ncbi:MAG: hypothetical protein MUQ27_15645, partial [Acidimicrobiia bacterium]|nr:hypothetical protein [Acidimicrobiia bacterium]
VTSGSIRNPEETDALDVKLNIRDTEIAMFADGAELGTWPATAVTIRRIDSTSFEFIAEGDRLIFVPDDPATFGDSPLVDGGDAGTGSRRGRKSRKKSGGTESRLESDQASHEAGRPPGRWSAAQEPSTEKASKPTRRGRRAAARAARGEAPPAEVVPVPPLAVPRPIAATSDDERPAADDAPSDGRGRASARSGLAALHPEPDGASSNVSEESSSGVWIRALDMARHYDIFGLDRVPIDEGLRGHEHQHSWDHRVVASSGLGRHICTICGATRRKAD